MRVFLYFLVIPAGGGAGGYISSVQGELSGGNTPVLPPFEALRGVVYTITVGSGGTATALGPVPEPAGAVSFSVIRLFSTFV